MTNPVRSSGSEMKQQIKKILGKPYARILIPDDDGTYTAEILEFPGCYGEGDTAVDAFNDLEQAAASWIEAAFKQGQEIPDPLDNCGYSGKINLRLPKSIHKQAARFAERDNISLNQFFAAAIAARIGAEDFYGRLIDKFQPMTTVVIKSVSTSYNCVMFPFDEMNILSQHQETGKYITASSPDFIEEEKVSHNG